MEEVQRRVYVMFCSLYCLYLTPFVYCQNFLQCISTYRCYVFCSETPLVFFLTYVAMSLYQINTSCYYKYLCLWVI